MPWSTTLRIEQDIKLLVRSPEGNDLIKARLPFRPGHPRALLTMLEGIALLAGRPLCVVISAGASRPAVLALEQWCDELWPGESALVHFEFALPTRGAHRRRHDVADGRGARRQLRLVWSR